MYIHTYIHIYIYTYIHIIHVLFTTNVHTIHHILGVIYPIYLCALHVSFIAPIRFSSFNHPTPLSTISIYIYVCVCVCVCVEPLDPHISLYHVSHQSYPPTYPFLLFLLLLHSFLLFSSSVPPLLPFVLSLFLSLSPRHPPHPHHLCSAVFASLGASSVVFC
jgi:hypothetical protein